MGKIAKGASRAVGGNQNLALAIGVVAAVAIPFAAPLVASALVGSAAVAGATTFALTSAAVGVAAGATAGLAAGSLTGTQGTSALIGGVGGGVGGFLGGGGANVLFGPSTPTMSSELAANAQNFGAGYGGAESYGAAVSAEPIAPGLNVASTGAEVGIGSAGFELPLPPEFLSPEQAAALSASAEGATTTAAAAPATGIGSATGGALPAKPEAAAQGSWWERFGGGLAGKGASIATAEGLGKAASGLVSPAGLMGAGQLAMTLFNKPPEGLTPQERAYVDETATLASTNRQQFDARVSEARKILARGTANPEQAYASASGGYQRRARSAGLRSPEDMRRAMLEGARAGSQAVPNEENRAYGATVAGLSAMPGSAPAGPAAFALGAYRDADQRQREYQAGIGRSLGGLASAVGGRSSLYG